MLGKNVGEIQTELGLEASDVPPSVRLDSKPIETEEAYRRKTMDPESEIVQRLDEQHIATKEAIEAGQTKLVTDLQVENPFDENTVGQQFNTQFEEHRNTIDKEISDEYNEATDNVLHKYLDEQGDLTDENITGSGKADQADVEGDIPGDKAGLGVTPTKNPDGSTFYPQITEAQLKAWDEDPDIYFRIDEKGRREEQGWMGEARARILF